MDIRLVPASERPPDCAYCREPVADLTAPGRATGCPECGAVLHADCARELGGACPTVGCANPAAAGTRSPGVVESEKAGPPAAASHGGRSRWFVRLAVLGLVAVLGWKHADRLRALRLSPTERRGAVVAHLDAGQKLIHEGYRGDREKLRQAKVELERALALDPQHLDALEQLGHAQWALDEREAALETFGRMIELHPHRVRGYYWRAQRRLTQGDVAGALSDFERSIAVEAQDSYARPGAVDDRYAGRAECRARLGDLRGAEADYTTFLAAWPLAPQLRDRGLVRAELGRREEAVEDLARALADSPGLREDYLRRIEQRPDSKGAECLRAALQRVPLPGEDLPGPGEGLPGEGLPGEGLLGLPGEGLPGERR